MLFNGWPGVLHDWRAPPPAKLFSPMCFSPIRIKNPKKDLVLGMDSQYLTVPCNNCPECRMHKQDEWYVRSYYEYQRCLSIGGYAQAITLTYNETSLPRCTSLKLPCFSRKHIQNFLKLVRDKVGKDLRFFMSCEYGDEKHRPHYHFLFYVPPAIERSLLIKAIAQSWHHGIIYTSNINDGLIIDLRGIRYVSKYCVKDLLQNEWFLKNRELLKRRYKITDKVRWNSPECKRYREELAEFEKSRPFIQSSMHYGYYAIETHAFSRQEIVEGYVRLESHAKPEGIRYKMPMYYERHLLYDMYKKGEKQTPAYRLNDFGKEIMKLRFQIRVDALEYKLKESRNIVNTFGFLSSYPKYQKYSQEELNRILSPSSDFISTYAHLSRYYNIDPPVEMPIEYAFLDYIPYVSVRQHYKDVIAYSHKRPGEEYSPDDGSMFVEVGLDFIRDIHMTFATDYFRRFHYLFQDCQDYLARVANERQREEEKLSIAIKIYKRKQMRSKHSNYIDNA